MVATNTVTFRIDAVERSLIEQAAKLNSSSLSDYVRRHALVAAQMDLMERRKIEVAPEHWEEVEAWMSQPPRVDPKISAFLNGPSPWDSTDD